MKILVISDTHGNTDKLKNELLPKYAKLVQMVVRLGDYARDLLTLQPDYPCIAMVGVGGAMEYGEKTERVVVANGCKILLLHGHNIGVKTNLNRITYYAREKGVDACFFGHTHQPMIDTLDGIFFMNPGSLTEPRSAPYCSYSLATISPDGKITGEVIPV